MVYLLGEKGLQIVGRESRIILFWKETNQERTLKWVSATSVVPIARLKRPKGLEGGQIFDAGLRGRGSSRKPKVEDL